MVITLGTLESAGACKEWRDIFAYRRPQGLTVEGKQDIVDAILFGGFGPVIGWLLSERLGVVDRIDLSGADLVGANLRGADLVGANLRRAYLRDADLVGADLRDADLVGANLRDADLRGADLRGANLRDADLRGANLGGADLGSASFARITVRQLQYVHNLDQTFLVALSEREAKEATAAAEAVSL